MKILRKRVKPTRELQYEPLVYRLAGALLGLWSDEKLIKYTNMHLLCTEADVKARLDRFLRAYVFAILRPLSALVLFFRSALDSARQRY